jgi:hypothetical protein
MFRCCHVMGEDGGGGAEELVVCCGCSRSSSILFSTRRRKELRLCCSCDDSEDSGTVSMEMTSLLSSSAVAVRDASSVIGVRDDATAGVVAADM